MADNFATDGSGNVLSKNFASREVTYSGDTVRHIVPAGIAMIEGSDDAKTATDVSDAKPFPVKTAFATANTPTTVSPTTSVATILAANANRRKLILVNESTVDCFIRWAAGATTTAYHEKLLAGDRLELDGYTGQVTGITASGTAVIRPTEFTT